MDVATLIQRRAARLWNEEYAAGHGRPLRGEPGAPPLRQALEDLAERVCRLTVVVDDSLAGTNVEGELDLNSGLILLRPGLDPHRADFVLAHEIGHWALQHPAMAIGQDTAETIDTEVAADELSAERQRMVTGIDVSQAGLTALRGYSERETYEMQANAFASELLVPSGDLRRLLEADPQAAVPELAARFEVPVVQMRFAMAQALLGSGGHAAAVAPAPNDAAAAAAPLPLDPDQQRAVDCAAPALVVAGPGAGKTRILVRRYARLVAEGESPRSIVALTFANKAAGEMRERLAAQVPPEHAANIEVYTFHSFGLALLQQYGERIGLTLPLRLITPMDALLLFRRRAAQAAYGFLSDLPQALKRLRDMLKAVARAKEENAGPERWEELARDWRSAHPAEPVPDWAADGARFYGEYQAALRRHSLLDYGDLLVESLRLFDIPEVAAEIRDRYRHVLVDEFQDIDYVSGRLVRALDGGRGVVWVVGDPRQSIYGFRGASPVNLSRFRTPDYYPGAAVIPLTVNYRSVPDIVAAGMAVPVPLPAAVLEEAPPALQAHRPAAGQGPAVTSVQLPDADAERRWLAGQIAAERAAGRPLSDIAVLVRTKKHGGAIGDALTAAGIPHRWGGPLSDRPAFKVMASALLLADDDPRALIGLTSLSPCAGLPLDYPLGDLERRILFADGRGRWGAKRLLRAAASGEIDGLAESARDVCVRLLALAEALSHTARPRHNLGVYLFEHARWVRALLPKRVRGDFRAAAVLATAGQTLDLTASFAAQRDALARGLRSSGDRPQDAADDADAAAAVDVQTSTRAFLSYVDSALEGDGLGGPDDLPVDPSVDAVHVLTAHRSKGLEWPVVFVPCAVDGQFPSRDRNDDVPLPPGLIVTDDDDPAAAHEREEACLFYVAVTRAQDRLYVSGADRYGRYNGRKSSLRATLEERLRAEERLAEPDIVLANLPILGSQAAQSAAPFSFTLPDPLTDRALNIYEACPRQFWYTVVCGIRAPGDPFTRFYSAVYDAARDAGGDPEKLRAGFDENWKLHGPAPSAWQAPLLQPAAERLVESFAGRMAAGADTAFRQPQVLRLDLGGGETQAIAFAVDEEVRKADGGRVLRRHKQGTRPPEKGPDDDRATLYALFADQEGGGGAASAEVVFHYPHAGGADVPAKIGDRKRENRRQKLVTLVERLRSGDMAPTPGQACEKCPYRLVCAGQ